MNIKGSAVHLRKTLMNLVSNAAEAQPDGGEVIIRTRNQYMDTPLQGYDHVNEGDYVVLEISDRGTGIEPQDLERIFEPFYSKKVMGRSGTGLGMAVVWGTVQDHHGYINVRSTPGIGTIFHLYFPVTRELNPQEPGVVLPADFMGSGQTILVVDDVAEQRRIATQILTRLNYKTHAVSSGEAAVEYLRHTPADILILDMIMDPGMDGLDTYTRILEFMPAQKAVIASGYAENERVKQAQALGAGPYIKKPYTIDKLGQAIHLELNR
jgi:CheY-like chemotaxis protein